jgi:hypothetical protein
MHIEAESPYSQYQVQDHDITYQAEVTLILQLFSDSTKKSSVACLPWAMNAGLPDKPVPSQSKASNRKWGDNPSKFLQRVEDKTSPYMYKLKG